MKAWQTVGTTLFLITGCEWSYDRSNAPPPPAPQIEVSQEDITGDPAEAPSLPLELEVEELRLVVKTLAAENRRLKEQLRSLETAPTAAPPSPTPEPTPTERRQSAAPPPEGADVLYVNPNWHYLVINQGSEDGFRVSDQVEIQRQDAPIGLAVITEVKPGQAVAEIDLDSLGSTGLYPRKHDRAVKP